MGEVSINRLQINRLLNLGKGFGNQVVFLTASVSPIAINYSLGSNFYITNPPATNFTLQFSNIPVKTQNTTITIYLNNTTNKTVGNVVTINGGGNVTPNFANGVSIVTASTIVVTNSGSGAYLINGSSNAVISLVRGNTYYLQMNASGHPFWIQTVSGGYSSGNIYNSGVTNNGYDTGIITFTVPIDAPNTLYYACQYHASMQGSITITGSGSQITTSAFTVQTFTFLNGISPVLANITAFN
jgi:hypothetical protein